MLRIHNTSTAHWYRLPDIYSHFMGICDVKARNKQPSDIRLRNMVRVSQVQDSLVILNRESCCYLSYEIYVKFLAADILMRASDSAAPDTRTQYINRD